MYKILIAAPSGIYPGCPIDVTGETKDFFTSQAAECWCSTDPDELVQCDGVVVPGGLPDVNPAYWNEPNTGCHVVDNAMDQAQMNMIQRAVALRKPIFGICRGLQLVSVYFGATLIQDIACREEHRYEPGVPRFHDIYNVPGTPLHDIYGDIVHGNSGHHQALKDLPECLLVSQVWCADKKKAEEYIQLAQAGKLRKGTDECIIEAVYHKKYPFVGLQWHPELGGELFCRDADVDKIRTLFYSMIQKSGQLLSTP